MHLVRFPSRVGGVVPRDRLWRFFSLAALLAAMLSFIGLADGEDVTPAMAATGSGLYVFGTIGGTALSSPYSSGTNPLLTWAELEPKEGSYDWATLDKALADAQKAGRTVMLRVFTNRSGGAQASPTWFFSSPGAAYYYPAGSTYRSPVAWDPVYQEKFGRFVEALGQRYDGHSALELIQITGVGVYGEMYLGYRNPGGYSVTKHKDAIRYWTDTWASAFKTTRKSITVNALGSNIAEGGAAYAVSRGYYLQMNSPSGNSPTRAILSAHDASTKIVIEAENGGCKEATGSAFAQLIDTVFSYDYSVHYLVLCNQSFVSTSTGDTLSTAISLLDGSGSVVPAAATPTTEPASATSTPVPTATPKAATQSPAPTATRTPAPTATRTPTPTATSKPAQPTPTPTSSFRWWSWWFR